MPNKQSHRQLFLRNVLQNPSADSPRLAYADWLTDNGEQERAEIIRTQICCCKAENRYVDSGPFLMESPLGKLMGFPSTKRGLWLAQFWLCRGFVRKIKLFHVPFLRLARSYFSLHPIESVELVGKSPVAYQELHVGSNSNYYGWVISSEGEEHAIPIALFNSLTDADLSAGDYEKYYATKEASLEAISMACVRYGRSRAGFNE